MNDDVAHWLTNGVAGPSRANCVNCHCPVGPVAACRHPLLHLGAQQHPHQHHVVVQAGSSGHGQTVHESSQAQAGLAGGAALVQRLVTAGLGDV
jgi:hypothetical protein